MRNHHFSSLFDLYEKSSEAVQEQLSELLAELHKEWRCHRFGKSLGVPGRECPRVSLRWADLPTGEKFRITWAGQGYSSRIVAEIDDPIDGLHRLLGNEPLISPIQVWLRVSDENGLFAGLGKAAVDSHDFRRHFRIFSSDRPHLLWAVSALYQHLTGIDYRASQIGLHTQVRWNGQKLTDGWEVATESLNLTALKNEGSLADYFCAHAKDSNEEIVARCYWHLLKVNNVRFPRKGQYFAFVPEINSISPTKFEGLLIEIGRSLEVLRMNLEDGALADKGAAFSGPRTAKASEKRKADGADTRRRLDRWKKQVPVVQKKNGNVNYRAWAREIEAYAKSINTPDREMVVLRTIENFLKSENSSN